MASGRFKPGQSGNPSGRRKLDLSIREIARAHTQECIDLLMAIARGAHKVEQRIEAMREVLDRGWNRPGTMLEAVAEGQSISEITVRYVNDWREKSGDSAPPLAPRPTDRPPTSGTH